MPTWFIFALLAPMLWAITNHLDKYVISRYLHNKNPGSLVLFSSFILGVASLLIFIFAPLEKISTLQALGGIFAGMLLIAGYIPYMYALAEDEVSVAAPLFQMMAPLSYLAGVIFLHESLSIRQILAGFLVVVGAVIMTLNFDKLVWKGRIFNLMLLSSVILTMNAVIFKIIGLESSYWTAFFWWNLGAFIFGILLFFLPSYRRDFLGFVREGGKFIFSLNVLSETINVIANVFSRYALLLAPIALISVVNSLQPFFIFIYGLILALFFPKIQMENFSKRYFFFKIIAIVIMIIGSVLLI